MTVQTKTIGRLPVNLGAYDSTRAYGRKNRVLQYGCELESLVDNNTYAPMTWDGSETFTLDSTHWRLVSGNPEVWAAGNPKPASTGTTGDYPYNGMGRVVLKKNMVNVGTSENPDYVNQLTQDAFEDGEGNPLTNTVFEVPYEFELAEDITIPAGCVLEFDGGSICGSNALVFNSCLLAGNIKILSDYSGTIKNEYYDVTWFGAVGDGTTDNADILQDLIDKVVDYVIYFPVGVFGISKTVKLKKNGKTRFRGINKSLSTIKALGVMDVMFGEDSASDYSVPDFKDIGFDGNGVAKGGVKTKTLWYTVFKDLLFRNIDGVCLEVNETWDVDYTGIMFRDSITAIVINNLVNGISIKHCEFNTLTYGYFGNGGVITFENNIFEVIEKFAISINGSCNILNNYFEKIHYEGTTTIKDYDGSYVLVDIKTPIILRDRPFSYDTFIAGTVFHRIGTISNSIVNIENNYIQMLNEEGLDCIVFTCGTRRLDVENNNIEYVGTADLANISAVGLCKVNGFSCMHLYAISNGFNYRNSYYAATGIRKIFIDVKSNTTYGQLIDIKTDYFEDTNTRPSNPEIGRGYWDQTAQKIIYWNGTAWVDATGTPV